MSYLHVNGIDLFYEVYGEGLPLVFLHGNGEDHTIFTDLIQSLQTQYCIYAFDMRGHGKSSAVEEYHYADMTEDFAQAFALLFDQPVDILGFSDGGIVALFLSIWFPKQVRRLILCGANYHPYGIKEEARLGMMQEYYEDANPLIPLMLNEPWLTEDDLQKVKAPAWVIVGEHDIIEHAHARELACLTNSRLLILENETHTSYVVHSDLLADLCLEFFVPTKEREKGL